MRECGGKKEHHQFLANQLDPCATGSARGLAEKWRCRFSGHARFFLFLSVAWRQSCRLPRITYVRLSDDWIGWVFMNSDEGELSEVNGWVWCLITTSPVQPEISNQSIGLCYLGNDNRWGGAGREKSELWNWGVLFWARRWEVGWFIQWLLQLTNWRWGYHRIDYSSLTLSWIPYLWLKYSRNIIDAYEGQVGLRLARKGW